MQLYYLNGLLKQQFGFCSVPFIHCSVTHSSLQGTRWALDWKMCWEMSYCM